MRKLNPTSSLENHSAASVAKTLCAEYPAISLRVLVTACALLFLRSTEAALPPHAPSLSVHESCYGTALDGNTRVSIQGLEIRVVSHADTTKPYQVQCFFLKKGKKESPVIVDDTVIFDVVNPHATYEVIAHPIKVADAGSNQAARKSKSKSGKSAGKSSKTRTSSQTKSSSIKNPREGYVVRIAYEGEVLRTHYSGHPLEESLQLTPSLLDQEVLKKSARHLQADDLLKR